MPANDPEPAPARWDGDGESLWEFVGGQARDGAGHQERAGPALAGGSQTYSGRGSSSRGTLSRASASS